MLAFVKPHLVSSCPALQPAQVLWLGSTAFSCISEAVFLAWKSFSSKSIAFLGLHTPSNVVQQRKKHILCPFCHGLHIQKVLCLSSIQESQEDSMSPRPSTAGPRSKVTKQCLLGTQVSHRFCSLPENLIIHLMGNLLPSGHSELDLQYARHPSEVSVWHRWGATTAWYHWRSGCC